MQNIKLGLSHSCVGSKLPNIKQNKKYWGQSHARVGIMLLGIGNIYYGGQSYPRARKTLRAIGYNPIAGANHMSPFIELGRRTVCGRPRRWRREEKRVPERGAPRKQGAGCRSVIGASRWRKIEIYIYRERELSEHAEIATTAACKCCAEVSVRRADRCLWRGQRGFTFTF